MSVAKKKAAYYPGCTLKSVDIAFDTTTKAVTRTLGLELQEVTDYSCCGAGEMKSEGNVSYLLPTRNLLRVAEMGRDEVVMSCNVCYHEMTRANTAVKGNPAKKQHLNALLEEAGEKSYEGNITARNTLEFIYNEGGLEEIKANVRKPLTGLKVAPYYGCLYNRPQDMLDVSPSVQLDDLERPHFMHDILEALGATVVRFGNETSCCGGKNVMSDEPNTHKLSGKVLASAKAAGADVLALMCPKCAATLDILQGDIIHAVGEEARLPVVFYTQLMAMAFGHPASEVRLKNMESNPQAVLSRFS